MTQNEKMAIVQNICSSATMGTDCKGLSLKEQATELMKGYGIPTTAKITEIPLYWNNQVSILFTVDGVKECVYELALGNSASDGEFFEILCMSESGKELPLDYFANLIGYYALTEPKNVIVTTGYTRYDYYKTVGVGVYPVKVCRSAQLKNGVTVVNYASIEYGDGVDELPYGFMLATDPNFTPCNGWEVETHTYYSDTASKEITTGSVFKNERK